VSAPYPVLTRLHALEPSSHETNLFVKGYGPVSSPQIRGGCTSPKVLSRCSHFVTIFGKLSPAFHLVKNIRPEKILSDVAASLLHLLMWMRTLFRSYGTLSASNSGCRSRTSFRRSFGSDFSFTLMAICQRLERRLATRKPLRTCALCRINRRIIKGSI
jgi:hypothetical protein